MVPVPVMDIGEVRMSVAQPPVLMLVTVGLIAVPVERVFMPMVLIVSMCM